MYKNRRFASFCFPMISGECILSLYSTATQNTLRRGLALGNAPDARILRWGYQHVGILQPTQTFKFASPPTPKPKNASPPTPNPKICVTPDANPRRQSVEYRWRWVPNAKFSRWACTFRVVYVNFICVGHPTQTRFSVEYGL